MPLAVFTTLHDRDVAKALARSAVERNLAACVHFEEIQSVFEWDGAVQDEPEFRLLFKTSAAGYSALEAHILKEHPYDVPALWSMEMGKGNKDFYAWIDTSVRTGG